MARILVVDDSPTARALLMYILESDPGLEVVGTAENGKEAVSENERLKPDLITMDISMPVMDGIEAIRRIMRSSPTPIIIISAVWDPASASNALRAAETGALALLEKPKGIDDPGYERMAADIVRHARLLSELPVVGRRIMSRSTADRSGSGRPATEPAPAPDSVKIVVIGASTGGPAVIQKILSSLDSGFPLPILIVQHIGGGFLQGMVGWLGHSVSLPIHIAAHGERTLNGHVYFAPPDSNMGISPEGKITLSRDDSDHGQMPSVSYLFDSAAGSFGRAALGVLLTGMGTDGAEGLYAMKKSGATTIVQDESSSVVFGMPREAIRIGAADYTLSPGQISEVLRSIGRRS